MDEDRIARAKQALPNGYCGLPLVQSCPHPNACLSCENFLTDSSFRHVHQQQLTHTQTLRECAEQNENVRLVELLEGDERSLRRILDGLDGLEADNAHASTSAGIDVIELASRRNTKRPAAYGANGRFRVRPAGSASPSTTGATRSRTTA